MKEINFLETQRRRLVQQTNKDRQILVISFGILGAVIVAFSSLWGYNYYLQVTTEDLNNKKTTLEEKIDVALKKQTSYLLFMRKLAQIETLVDQRQNGLEKLNFLDQNLGSQSVTARNFRYGMSEGTIRTSVEAENVFSAQDIFTELSLPEFKDNFPSIDYGGLNRSRNAIYTFSAVFNLGKK